MAVVFDTLEAATRLREEAGFDERQARVLVATFAEGIGESLATREDLENTATALRNEIGALRKNLGNTEAANGGDLSALEGRGIGGERTGSFPQAYRDGARRAEPDRGGARTRGEADGG